MKLSIDLTYKSSDEWVAVVMNDFDAFLQDHADCERKASAMAMSFVAKLSDRLEIIPELIDTAIEELEHFRDVYAIMQSRNIPLKKEIEQDLYANELVASCRSGKEERLLDRLLLASIMECRGSERFKLIYQALPEGELKKFYHTLWTTEAKHGNIYVKFALIYFSKEEVYKRLNELTIIEGQVVSRLKIRPALH
ncbi:MAG: tRNA-(ms[2]io[6]A)-hydroxylase [Bacteroidetes bacterium]|nr:tRNA-(ms[2]io[6]A)-hydroxylase [Bacteroidota bacterium]